MGYNYNVPGSLGTDKHQTLTSAPQPNQSFVAAMTSAERTALSDKALGTMVFDTGDNQLYVWNGSAWIDISTP